MPIHAGSSSKPKARVAIYVRVSTLYQVDKDSLPMQKQDLIAYAKLILGADDYVIFEDAGYSGKNMDRPKFQEMMSQIRTGVFTHLLVWKIDRISRNLLDFAGMYAELKELGVTFVSKNEQFDTSSAVGEAMLKIILIFAELERNMTSERVTATMISRASNGLWNGGKIPYGYDYDPETTTFSINDQECAVVRLMHDQYEEQRSLVRLARYLNEKGYRSRAGNYWSPISIHIILTNIFYCGDYRYNVLKEGNRQKVKDKSEWVIVKDHHIPIIGRDQKERIISMLDANRKLKRHRGHASKHTHVFGNMIFCGNCGKPMTSTTSNLKASGWRYSNYLCPTKRKSTTLCTGKSTSDSILGEFVFNYILNMLNAQRNFSEINSPAELQTALLIGDAFRYIQSIESDGLNDLYNVLLSGNVSGNIYGKSVRFKPKKVDSELSNLKSEKLRLERALDRLTNLYLYSEDAMSEREFIIQKTKLTESLDEVMEQIGFASSDAWQQSVTDEVFIQRASEFIIAQKLTDRSYINYQRLAMTVDNSVLKEFVSSVIDSITILDGMVKTIVFRNGLSHTFVFRDPSNE